MPNYSWAKMLAKVFKVDVTKCPSCGGDLAKLAAVTDPMAARRYLKHAGIPHDAPARAPPRSVQGEFDFEYAPFPTYDQEGLWRCDQYLHSLRMGVANHAWEAGSGSREVL